jgi:hypothetical protein
MIDNLGELKGRNIAVISVIPLNEPAEQAEA